MNRRTKIIVSVAGIFIVLLLLLGLTYAYFLTRINGNTNDKSISVTTDKLELTYSDNSSEILGNGTTIQPSSEPIGTKEFKVTNNGSDTNYSVVIENMKITNTADGTETEFLSNDFKYTLTCKKKDNTPCNNQTTEQTIFPLSDGALINNDIAKNDEHTYTLTMYYIETGLDQSNDMGKSISGKINIIDTKLTNPYKNNVKTLAYNIINNAINNKNGTEFRIIPKTIPAAEVTVLYEEKEDPYERTMDVDSTEQGYYWTYATDYKVNKKTGEFSLVDPQTCKYNESNCISDLVKSGEKVYVSANPRVSSTNKPTSTTNLSGVYRITDATNIASLKCKRIDSNPYSIESELSMAADDYGMSYYYRGRVKDNYLELNNMCFRIVRIQGDGSIKITLAKEGPCSTITESDTKTALISNADGIVEVPYGYDYDVSTDIYSFNYEGYEGGLYTTLNEWYNSKLSSVQDKLKNDT